MPKGTEPRDHYHSPPTSKSPEEFYEILDAFTWESFPEETTSHQHRVGFMIPMPPLSYEGRFIKGLLFSSAVDLIIDRFPVFRELFICIANSMWSSYPWARSADAYFVCYDNPRRSAWFRRSNPDRGHIAHIPLQDADFTHEYLIAPVPVLERNIDILCISRLHSLKNLPMIASALSIYRKKYCFEPIRMTLIAGKPGAYSHERMSEMERDQYSRMETILGRPEDFIDFVDHAKHYREIPSYFSRARAVVLGSLIEGKNRCINEAQSCNTPVICFESLNQYARGNTPSFPAEAGLTSAYDAEALADVMHTVLHNEDWFRPRAAYLRTNGRRRFLARCLETVGYFEKNVPDLLKGNAWENVWLDLAVQDNYGVSLYDFLYSRLAAVSHANGLEQVEQIAGFYSQKFEM